MGVTRSSPPSQPRERARGSKFEASSRRMPQSRRRTPCVKKARARERARRAIVSLDRSRVCETSAPRDQPTPSPRPACDEAVARRVARAGGARHARRCARGSVRRDGLTAALLRAVFVVVFVLRSLIRASLRAGTRRSARRSRASAAHSGRSPCSRSRRASGRVARVIAAVAVAHPPPGRPTRLRVRRRSGGTRHARRAGPILLLLPVCFLGQVSGYVTRDCCVVLSVVRLCGVVVFRCHCAPTRSPALIGAPGCCRIIVAASRAASCVASSRCCCRSRVRLAFTCRGVVFTSKQLWMDE